MMKTFSRYGAYAGIIFLVAAGINYSLQDYLDTLSTVLLYAGGILVLAGVMLHLQELLAFSRRRDTRYGGNSIVVIILVLLIIGMANFIGSRRNYRWDTTVSGQFSLSQQTVQVLQNLEKEVKITGFFKTGSPQLRSMQDLISEYEYYTDNLTVRFIDPDKEPEVAQEFDITVYNTTILEAGEMREEVTSPDEETVSNALIKVTRDRKKILYFTEGHNEKDPDGTDATGYSSVKEALVNQNYEVRKVLLAREKSVPEDCEVLIIAGPANAFFQAELDTIDHWLSRGGKALFMVDPDPSPGMAEYFQHWDVQVGDDLVIDLSGIGQLFGAGPGIPLVSTYKDHDIVKDFGGIATFFPYTRSVRPAENVSGGTVVASLFESTPRSFGETEFTEGEGVSFTAGKDLEGPVSLAVTVIRSAEAGGANTGDGGKLVIVGDSDFATNTYFRQQGNGDLFLNMASWLAEESDLISIRPRQVDDRRVNLTSAQSDMFFWLSLGGLPGLVLLSGLIVFFRRRSR